MTLNKRATATAAVLACGILLAGTTPASASTRSTSGTTTSIWTFTTGTYDYYQNHAGDDFGFNLGTGAAIDMRWINCGHTVTGPIEYNLTTSEGRRTLGANFQAGYCLNSQFRGFSQTGSFTGVMHYNYSWQ